MKRIITITLLLVIVLSAMNISVFAAPATATMTGPDTVRAGETITITFNMNGTGLFGMEGTLSYDTSKLTLSGTPKNVIGGNWKVEFNDNNFLAYDDALSNPVNKNTKIFSVNFKVASDLTPGTEIAVSMTKTALSDGSTETNVGTVSYTATIAPPKSTDNTLKTLTVSNADISPAFSPDVTEYTTEVPFSVSNLAVSATANDTKATVTVKNSTLVANATTKITITVKAEDGSTKIYTISAKRAQDPNYVPSSNNNASNIKVDGFLLSPAFSTEVTSYVVWLPYETESITLSGSAADKNASIEVVGGTNLEAGKDNVVKVICTAEDGTTKEYTVIAKRAAAHGSDPVIPDPSDPTEPSEPSEPSQPTEPSEPTEPSQPTEPSEPTEPSQPTEPSEPTEPSQPSDDPTQPSPPATDPTEPSSGDNTPAPGVPVIVLVIVAVICLGAGLGVGIIIGKKKQ